MAKTYDNMKIRFSLIAEHLLAFASHPNIGSKVKICLQISRKVRDIVLRYRKFSFG